MREINERFVMVPTSLLEVPEFVRHFDSKAVGSIYRLLCSKLWRVPKENLFKNSSERNRQLTELYEKGLLVSFYDLSSLAAASGYEDRSVRRELAKLEGLGLIEVRKIDGNTFYSVGLSNIGAGYSGESFYLNRWRDFVSFCELSDEYSPALAEFRSSLLSFFSTDKSENGQKCHQFLTNLSQKSGLEDIRNFVLDVVSEYSDASIKEDLKEKDLLGPGQGQKSDIIPETPDLSSEEFEEVEAKKMLISSLVSASDFVETLTLVRSGISSGVLTLDEGNAALRTKLSDEARTFQKYPRFANALDEQKDWSVKDKTKVLRIWSSLHEDFTGITLSGGQNEYKKHMSVVGNVLKFASLEQILWTLRFVASNHPGDTEFLSRGSQTLGFMVKKYAKVYQERKSEDLRRKEVRAKLSEPASETKQGCAEEVEDNFPDPFGDNFALTSGNTFRVFEEKLRG